MQRGYAERIAILLLITGTLALGMTGPGCRDRSGDEAEGRGDPRVAKLLLTAESVHPQFPIRAYLHERSGRGVAAYLGFDVDPPHPRPNDTVTMTHYFELVAPFSANYDVFVHGEAEGGGSGGRIFIADHSPILGLVPTGSWKKGEVWADPHRVQIPDRLPASGIEIFVGLFKRDTRLTVEAPPGRNDGRNRIRAGVLNIEGVSDDLPIATIAHLRAGEVVHADGVLDEPAWAKAEILSLSDSMGRTSTPKYPTKLRLMYDDENLYVAFECTDVDISERYAHRDDPIYEHESVEIFLMPEVQAPALGPYVELQASPGGVIFDAAFVARRQGMDKSFDAGQTVGTHIDGTLNELDVDKGWVSEWVVPWKQVRGVSHPPRAGDEWRMNAFRIEKFRGQGPSPEGSEFTAWSPPRIGDFHNVTRFGRMRFGPAIE